MPSLWWVGLSLAFLAPACLAAEPEGYVLKVVEAAAPKELKDAIRKELFGTCYQVFNPKGDLHCEIWLRAKVPAAVSAEQVKNGLSYKDLEQTEFVGAIRFPAVFGDYRKQELAAGVYTLRLAVQPQDGDHMGTAPHPEFVLVLAADKDESPAPLDVKALHEKSAEAAGTNHPGVLLLFPTPKPPDVPKLTKEADDHWVARLALNLEVKAGPPAKLGLGLCVVGHSSAGTRR